MDILFGINEYPFNGCVRISAGFLDDSIGRMDIVELATYERKWWYVVLICFVLGFMAGARTNTIALLLYSNFLDRTVGETVPKLYPRAFVYFRRYMLGMVLCSD